MSRIFGIDLGTTASLIALLQEGRPKLIPNRAGKVSTPSIVGLSPSGQLLVGAAAKAQLVEHPDRTVAEVKRLMGSDAVVRLGDRSYSPTEISALILRSLKDDAEAQLGEPVREAVVTVPAYFTDPQRKATKRAGEIAGLIVERIINEPTAAALAYGLDNLDKEQLVLVYDLGGGTLDVSLLEMFDGVLEVKASAGNNRLGGCDVDRMVVAFLHEAVERQLGISVRHDLRAVALLTQAAEQAKIALSSAEVTTVSIPELVMTDGRARSFSLELARKQLEAQVLELMQSTLRPIEAALADAKVAREAVSEIVLVGGASRMPLVRRLVAEHFGKEPLTGIEPEHAIALGAAVQGGLKSGAIAAQTGIMITDVAPFTLGVEVQGAAGSQSVGGLFSPIIPRNSTIPISRTESYATTQDGQRQVTIRVYQGESRFVRNNVYLDEYTIDGVPAAPAGREKVLVTFAYDLNGILQVTTKIASTGKEVSITVSRKQGESSALMEDGARERLEREWAMGRALAAPAAAATSTGLSRLVEAAEAKLPALSGAQAERLGAALKRAKSALVTGDEAAREAADEQLTDVLLELA